MVGCPGLQGRSKRRNSSSQAQGPDPYSTLYLAQKGLQSGTLPGQKALAIISPSSRLSSQGEGRGCGLSLSVSIDAPSLNCFYSYLWP